MFVDIVIPYPYPSSFYLKNYCNTIVRDNITVTLSLNKNNKINKINNLINNNNLIKNTVNVTVTISCLLLLHYLFSTF